MFARLKMRIKRTYYESPFHKCVFTNPIVTSASAAWGKYGCPISLYNIPDGYIYDNRKVEISFCKCGRKKHIVYDDELFFPLEGKVYLSEKQTSNQLLLFKERN